MITELFYVGLLLLALGAGGGFIAGLLGLGGGVIFVPGLYYILRYFDYSEHAMHIAVGTSLLLIVFTGVSSAYAHHKRGAVDVDLLKQFLPGVLIGVGVGTFLAGIVSGSSLKLVFACSQLLLASYMLFRVNRGIVFDAMPRQPLLSVVAFLNACLSTMMGIGGGVLNVTFMTLCNVPIHRAIGTAAAIGPFIAVIGAIGFFYIGLGRNGLPPFSAGYLNMAAFAVIVPASVLCAPLGAKMAHSLPVQKLKRCFSVFMLLLALKMLSEVFYA
jgi:uncharacterized membrane protein YfcA